MWVIEGPDPDDPSPKLQATVVNGPAVDVLVNTKDRATAPVANVKSAMGAVIDTGRVMLLVPVAFVTVILTSNEPPGPNVCVLVAPVPTEPSPKSQAMLVNGAPADAFVNVTVRAGLGAAA